MLLRVGGGGDVVQQEAHQNRSYGFITCSLRFPLALSLPFLLSFSLLTYFLVLTCRKYLLITLRFQTNIQISLLQSTERGQFSLTP